jgi:hypothetical protein
LATITREPAVLCLPHNIHETIVFILENYGDAKPPESVIRASDLRLFEIEDNHKIERCGPVPRF